MIPQGFYQHRWYLRNRTLFCFVCDDWKMHVWDEDVGAFVCENWINHETMFPMQEEPQIEKRPSLPVLSEEAERILQDEVRRHAIEHVALV